MELGAGLAITDADAPLYTEAARPKTAMGKRFLSPGYPIDRSLLVKTPAAHTRKTPTSPRPTALEMPP